MNDRNTKLGNPKRRERPNDKVQTMALYRIPMRAQKEKNFQVTGQLVFMIHAEQLSIVINKMN